MKTSSCKAKGRLGQQEVAQLLRKTFPKLLTSDVRSASMGCPGEDIQLSQEARALIPWNIEVKRGKAFNLVKACKQSEKRGSELEPVAMGRYDRDSTWYACVRLGYLLELLKDNRNYQFIIKKIEGRS